MIGKTISHYKILEKLGEGGMGIVYKAADLQLQRPVALKFLAASVLGGEQGKARFMREARAAAALNHPNICTIYEFDEVDERAFIAMEYVEGRSLKQRIKTGPLPLDEVLTIALQVAEGLRTAHGGGIVHRDVKPANVMMTPGGQAKILDFGLATSAGATKVTRTGTTLGTAAYMSPEQLQGKPIDRRTDIWSLGAMLYEMVTGDLPFKGDREQTVMFGILNEQPEPVTGVRTGVPIELDRIIGKCLHKEPAERYQTAADLNADILHLQRTRSESSQRKLAARSSQPHGPVLRWWMVGAVLVAIVAAVLILFPRQPAPPGQSPEAERMRLVVLPFENLGSPEDEYFAAGITEEITSRLGTVERLGVISRKSAVHYAGSDKTIKQIGEELGVDYALEGTIRWARASERSGSVRITAQLIRVSDDTHLWAESYNRILEDIFEVQSDIARMVVQQLGIVLHKADRPTFDIRPTENLEAYQAYLRGRYFGGQPHFSAAETQKALDAFQQAVQLDSSFTLAYTELAKSHARFYYYRYDPSQERRGLAREAMERALDLEPDSPQVRLAFGYYHLLVERDVRQALTEFAAAARDLPESGDVLEAKADALRMRGRWDEALKSYLMASELNPRSSSPIAELSMTYWWMRRYPEALQTAEKAITLAPDQIWPHLAKIFALYSWKGQLSEAQQEFQYLPKDHPWTYWIRYWHEMFSGRYGQALRSLDDLPNPWIRIKICARPQPMFAALAYSLLDEPLLAATAYDSARIMLEREVQTWPDDPRYHSSLGIVYAAQGHSQEAIQEGMRAAELYPISRDAVYGIPYLIDLAHIHTILGEVDEAVEQLDALLSMPSWLSVAWLKMDPRWNALHAEPRYQELLAKHSKDGS